ncbi:MAG: pseudouridine synthase [Chitinophagales bacterium]|nr:pseudouridine synthase [Chitinophagales bacterium]MCZ2393608.1 pseudouridine synthase [Chitinophagales bacterium]
MSQHQYFVIYKPFGMLSQFSGEEYNLSQLNYSFPKDIYPVGRLDKDSEGLLILTNDHHLQHRMTNPQYQHPRTYYVQVEGIPDSLALQQLQQGVNITLPNKKKYQTLPAKAFIIPCPSLPPRNPPIRERKNIPDTWLSITLTEGKNRQIRKMTAKAGFPTLRLVRVQIENLMLNHLKPGDIFEFSKIDIYSKLNL